MVEALVSFKSLLISLTWTFISSTKLFKVLSKLDMLDDGFDGFEVLGTSDGSPDGLYVTPLQVVIASVDLGRSLT